MGKTKKPTSKDRQRKYREKKKSSSSAINIFVSADTKEKLNYLKNEADEDQKEYGGYKFTYELFFTRWIDEVYNLYKKGNYQVRQCIDNIEYQHDDHDADEDARKRFIEIYREISFRYPDKFADYNEFDLDRLLKAFSLSDKDQ